MTPIHRTLLPMAVIAAMVVAGSAWGGDVDRKIGPRPTLKQQDSKAGPRPDSASGVKLKQGGPPASAPETNDTIGGGHMTNPSGSQVLKEATRLDPTTRWTSPLPEKGFGPRPDDGTPVVHPGDFDRIKEITDLANPWGKLKGTVGDPTGTSLPGTKSPEELMGEMRTLPGGPQNPSKRSQQSEEGGPTLTGSSETGWHVTPPVSPSGGLISSPRDPRIIGTFDEHGTFQAIRPDYRDRYPADTQQGQKDRQQATDAEKRLQRSYDAQAHPQQSQEKEKGIIESIGDALHQAWATIEHYVEGPDKFKYNAPNTAEGSRGKPDPMKDDLTTGGPPKSPHQVEIEHKRQVTLPGDDQGGPREKVTVDPKEAVTWGVKSGTGGRIDPGPSDGTETGWGAPAPGEGNAMRQHWGGRPGPKGPDGTVGPDKSKPPSRDPDNPTMSTGTGSTTKSEGELPRTNQ